ncbi:MAG: hypothetical protein SAL07_24120 [Oscillatoria sp. PMC 1051.18]|nr:hypothetical protein [Oscillatoria sp. PMC 1050.18]MEC5032997.1 hypothetical protein [Oscillatoria sp. PMC 1051.18]
MLNYWQRKIYYSRVYQQILKITGSKVIHCLGDSHIKIFEYISRENFWFHTRFKFSLVQGGTAMGLGHPKSKTQAIKVFSEYLQKVPKNDWLLFCLGEVDCGFVIWYRAEKYGVSVEEQFEYSLENYLNFLDELDKQGFKNIIISSVPLPTIIDDQDWGEVAKLRRSIKTSLQQRTALTRQYNRHLQNYCEKRDWFFLDFESEILDPETGTVAHQYRHPNPLDHHLNAETVAPIIIHKIKQLGYW